MYKVHFSDGSTAEVNDVNIGTVIAKAKGVTVTGHQVWDTPKGLASFFFKPQWAWL